MIDAPTDAGPGVRSRQRVMWVLTAVCPSRCSYCDIDSQRGISPLEEARVASTCEELLAAGFREVIFVGGEPLLARTLRAALDVLRGRCEVAVFTGGLPGAHDDALDALSRGVTRLVLSIDDASASLNDLVRGRRGIRDDLLRLAQRVRVELPQVGLSVNTVVTRHNVDRLDGLLDVLDQLRVDSWSLTVVGDNFEGSPTAELPDRAALARFYFEHVPRLARALRERARHRELIVLPLPYPLLARAVPPHAWASLDPALRVQAEAAIDDIARGDHNRRFVEAHGCPLVGLDVAIGVGGEVFPCSQAPILRPEYAVGDLRRESFAGALAGEALRTFAGGVPHAACTRCWAPSNLPRPLLASLLRGAA